MNRWKEINPDYKYILWDNEAVEGLFIHNFDLYNRFLNSSQVDKYAGACDVIRYEILHNFGGIYFDADCNPIQPLEDYLLYTNFFTCYLNEKARKDRLANGIIGCLSGDDIMLECICKLGDVVNIKEAFKCVGPVFFTNICKDFKLDIYPSYYFLPNFFNGEHSYEGTFKPFCDHEWGTTNRVYIKKDESV